MGVAVGVGVGVALAQTEPVVQVMVNSVPPRVMSRLPLALEVKVAPRKPASTELVVMGLWPLASAAFSLEMATFTVTVLFAVSNAPQSALPLDV